jgi:hypothetical protein
MKNVSRLNWIIATAIIMAGLFAGCKDDNNGIGNNLESGAFDGKITAKVVNGNQYDGLISTVKVMRWSEDDNGYEELASGNYSNGGFTLTLPTPDDKYLGEIAEDLAGGSVKVSDKNARAFTFSNIGAFNSTGQNVGRLYYRNETTGTVCTFFYADRDVTVTGSETVTEKGENGSKDYYYTYNYSVSLKSGWNKVYIVVRDGTSANTSIITFTTQAISGLKWYFQDNGDGGYDDLPVVETNPVAVSGITSNSATLGGYIYYAGMPEYYEKGFCYSTYPNPATGNSNTVTASGGGTGNFSVTVNGLAENTTYYVRAYAINNSGTAYGEQKSFTTETQIEGLAVVTTSEASGIGPNSATLGGVVIDIGIPGSFEKGFCYSTSQNPTIYYSNQVTVSGIGTGSYSVTVSQLQENTTYYVRAYVTNNAGTAYGQQVSFTTRQDGGINTWWNRTFSSYEACSAFDSTHGTVSYVVHTREYIIVVTIIYCLRDASVIENFS